MNQKLIKKLILGLIMLFMTALTLVSSTFAWFSQNREVWTDEFDIEIENSDSLLISVDGVNFRNSIPNDLLKKAIVSKKINKPINELTDKEVVDEYKNILLQPITTNDLSTFSHIGENSSIQNGYYTLVEADHNSYLSFDLWFKVAASRTATLEYNLKFVSDDYASEFGTLVSYINCLTSEVVLHNQLNTVDNLYQSNETIYVNARDAVRIGVIHNENLKTIYEPYIGLGSYALKDDINDIYNPEKNAMLTYFNNTHEGKLEPLENLDIYKNTQKDFNGGISFGKIVPNGDNTDYLPVKITVYIWLEGYDADYILGISNTNLKMMLNFCVEEV